MTLAEVRKKLTKLKLEYPDIVLPVPLCGKGITAKKLQKTLDNLKDSIDKAKKELEDNGGKHKPSN